MQAQPTTSANHAVVIGGSIAGLLAARVLSEHFAQVTIVERDQLPEGAEPRKGTPQSRHGHGLLAAGCQIMERLLPGFGDELVANGALPCDVIGDARWYQRGGYKAKFKSGLQGILVSRPLIEMVIRRRVLALPNVRLQEAGVQELVASADHSRVTGVRLADGTSVLADFVVDASGRGSRAPVWLEALGYAKPVEERINIGVGYATQIFRRRPADLNGDLAAFITPTAPEQTRVGFMVPMEGDRWIISVGGWLGDHPPTDAAGWIEFARTLSAPDIYEVVKNAEPLSDIVVHKIPANIRRRYEQLRRSPAGFVVMGDALCAFNPVYGQGMTVAALEVQALEELLQTDANLNNLHRRFFARVAKIVDVPWSMATGEDFRYPTIAGKRPAGTALLHRFLDRVHFVARYDAVVCRTFFDVANMLKPPTALFAPKMLWRVLTGGQKGQPAAPTYRGAMERVEPSLQGGM
ncbi:MAG: FAD-binding monooxygenase [Caldilinea sp. CFX5]|nr:FAD-binding monooxygenase [Caldilinea sp. CFX5]